MGDGDPDTSTRSLDAGGVPTTMVNACDIELLEHGDSAEGAGYVRGEAAARTCYDVMLGLIRPHEEDVSLLDLGCGAARLLDYIGAQGIEGIRYSGLDLSTTALAMARRKHPATRFSSVDLLAERARVARHDYVLMNGVFHWRGELSEEAMTHYWKRLLSVAFEHCRVGLAFNVMSHHVDWQREDLFHLPFDTMAAFVNAELSRHLTIRADYGVYEYTVYIYREAHSA